MVIRTTTLCVMTALAVFWVAAPVGAEDPTQPDAAANETPKADDGKAAEAGENVAKNSGGAPPTAMPVYRPPMMSKPSASAWRSSTNRSAPDGHAATHRGTALESAARRSAHRAHLDIWWPESSPGDLIVPGVPAS